MCLPPVECGIRNAVGSSGLADFAEDFQRRWGAGKTERGARYNRTGPPPEGAALDFRGPLVRPGTSAPAFSRPAEREVTALSPLFRAVSLRWPRRQHGGRWIAGGAGAAARRPSHPYGGRGAPGGEVLLPGQPCRTGGLRCGVSRAGP